MVSSDSGFRTILQVIASTSILSTVTSGKSLATSAATSSQSTIPFRWALLLVTTVRSFRGLLCAVSNANLMMRSTPCRVNMATSVAVSQGWPRWLRPPCPAYSPSEFSRTMTQSRSPVLQFLSGDWVPRKTLVGLTLAYCWKGWQMASRRPHSEMWSGTSSNLLAKKITCRRQTKGEVSVVWHLPGAPTAPNKMASCFLSSSSPPSGM